MLKTGFDVPSGTQTGMHGLSRSCEALAGQLVCQERCRNQFSPLLRSHEARAGQFGCYTSVRAMKGIEKDLLYSGGLVKWLKTLSMWNLTIKPACMSNAGPP